MSDDAHLKFIDLSAKGGLSNIISEEAKTSDKAT
jgi:hypothetical protein